MSVWKSSSYFAMGQKIFLSDPSSQLALESSAWKLHCDSSSASTIRVEVPERVMEDLLYILSAKMLTRRLI